VGRLSEALGARAGGKANYKGGAGTGGISVQIDPGDLSGLFAQMWRAEKELGKSAGEALRWGGWSLARTLGTSTRVAPKLRRFKQVGSVIRSRNGMFEVVSYKDGYRWPFIVYAKDVEAVKNLRSVRIGNRGLARASWMWGVRALGSGGGFPSGMSGANVSRAGNNMEVQKRLTGSDMFISFENKLRYAALAFKSKGRQTVATAAERAGRMMWRTINAKVYGSKFAK